MRNEAVSALHGSSQATEGLGSTSRSSNAPAALYENQRGGFVGPDRSSSTAAATTQLLARGQAGSIPASFTPAERKEFHRLLARLRNAVPDCSTAVAMAPMTSADGAVQQGARAKSTVDLCIAGKQPARGLFKNILSDADHAFESEALLAALSRVVGLPPVPLAPRFLGDQVGYVKMMIPNEGNLPLRPTRWTDADRMMILAYTPLIHLLRLSDSHAQQFVRVPVGDVGLPVLVDGDYSLSHGYDTQPLTRHKSGPGATPCEKHLMLEFVEAHVELHFGPVFEIITALETLDRTSVQTLLGPFIKKVFAGGPYGSYPNGEALVDEFFAQVRGLRAEFEQLRQQLETERQEGKAARAHVKDVGLRVRAAYDRSPARTVATGIARFARGLFAKTADEEAQTA